MVHTMLKSTYAKLETKILRNRFYKNFNDEFFLRDLQHVLNNNGKLAEFNDEFKAILRWLEGLTLIQLEQQKTQFPLIILAKYLN